MRTRVTTGTGLMAPKTSGPLKPSPKPGSLPHNLRKGREGADASTRYDGQTTSIGRKMPERTASTPRTCRKTSSRSSGRSASGGEIPETARRQLLCGNGQRVKRSLECRSSHLTTTVCRRLRRHNRSDCSGRSFPILDVEAAAKKTKGTSSKRPSPPHAVRKH